jgi:HSP20 family protein
MAKQSNTTKKRNGSNQLNTLQRSKEDLEKLAATPFAFMRRFGEEMDSLFADFGIGRGWLAPIEKGTNLAQGLWSPEVEVFERGKDLVVRADLPGLTKDDVNVEVADNGITIEGERKNEVNEEDEGYYRSERTYGKFYRRVPLPHGVKAEDAEATFRDGVLEITMPAAARDQKKSRKLQISGTASQRAQSRSHAA